MEVIRVPHVSLVDATGTRIGVYTDDPDWWQQLKLKRQRQQLAITSGEEEQNQFAQQKEDINLKVFSHNTPNANDSNQKATRALENQIVPVGGKQLAVPVAIDQQQLYEESQKQCNVIGESPLHIAIIYDDLPTIKVLIEKKGYTVNQKSSGVKFVPGFENKEASSLIKESKYESLAYYGEYPLAFAACFASKEVYDYLMEKGADPNLQDSYGNTVLHALVINNRLDMFQYATNHPIRKALLTIKNNQELTPVNLAAKLGRKDLFEKMLELRNIEFWRYSNITCSAYPLDGLDTIESDGKLAWNSAITFIVNGDTEDHLDMLEIGVVKRLLEDKWSTYAQRRFIQRLILSAIHLIFLCIAVYTRVADNANLNVWPVKQAVTWVRYISEIAVIIGCVAVLGMQVMEIYAQGFANYIKNLKDEPANVCYQAFCILILLAIPFRFVTFPNDSGATSRQVEDTLVILATPCGWCHLLFYMRVITVTGPFVVMIYKMIAGDIITFSSIYVLLLFGFSLAFYYLYKNVASGVETMNSFPEAMIITFQMGLGEFKARTPEFDEMYYSNFIKCVFVCFMILMHILLLNMLIAMMGNTYHQVIRKSEKEWRRQWSHCVILLERSFKPEELRKFQDQYSIKISSKDSDKSSVGLMVIKKAPKTKAYQKTICKRYWQKFGKAIIKMLKDTGLSSADFKKKFYETNKKVVRVKKVQQYFDWAKYGFHGRVKRIQEEEEARKGDPNGTTKLAIKSNSNQNAPPSVIIPASSSSSTLVRNMSKMLPNNANKVHPVNSSKPDESVPKVDLSELKRPFSSQSKTSDNSSELKRRTSPEGVESLNDNNANGNKKDSKY